MRQDVIRVSNDLHWMDQTTDCPNYPILILDRCIPSKNSIQFLSVCIRDTTSFLLMLLIHFSCLLRKTSDTSVVSLPVQKTPKKTHFTPTPTRSYRGLGCSWFLTKCHRKQASAIFSASNQKNMLKDMSKQVHSSRKWKLLYILFLNESSLREPVIQWSLIYLLLTLWNMLVAV